jgi:hypothetical protein
MQRLIYLPLKVTTERHGNVAGFLDQLVPEDPAGIAYVLPRAGGPTSTIAILPE